MTQREDEMSRMLLWFKAQLPPHAVDEWYIAVTPYPEPTVLEDSDTSVMRMSGCRGPDAQRVRGYGRCTRCRRCRMRFPIPENGNAIAFNESRVESVVEKMKQWVARDADRDGPCWGDVPSLPDSNAYATLDFGDRLPSDMPES